MEYKYDSDADILSVTIQDKAFDYASEMGDFIVHFSKEGKPVYLEILNASKFLTKAKNILPESAKQQIFH